MAALFAVHPTHVESVAWATERKDVLSTFFLILTFWCYVAYAERPNIKRYIGVLGLFLCGLMSKPMPVSVPLVMLVLDWWPLNRLSKQVADAPLTDDVTSSRPTRSKKRVQRSADTVEALPRPVATPWRLILEKVPLFVLSLGSCAATYLIQRNTGAMRVLATLPAGVRAANAVVAYTSYIGKVFWPVHLYYPYIHPERSLPQAAVLGSVAALIAITTTLFLLAKRFPYLLMGWLWYLITLLPVIGFVQVGPQAMADRYTYVPFIGMFIAITWLAIDLGSRFTTSISLDDRKNGQRLAINIPLFVAAIAIIVVLVPRTYRQVGYWRDLVTLYAHSIDCDPNDYIALTSTVSVLDQNGQLPKALVYAFRAVKAKPDYAVSRDNLSSVLLKSGRIDEGIEQSLIALKIRHDDALAPANLSLGYFFKGEQALRRRQYDVANEWYKKSWHNLHVARNRGYDLPPNFVDALGSRMIDPE